MHSISNYSFQRRTNSLIDHRPLPIRSISSALLVLVLFSTLSAMHTGLRRDYHEWIDVTKFPTDGSAVDAPAKIDDAKKKQHSGANKSSGIGNGGPTILSFRDLSTHELHPKAGPHRHIVTPPEDELPVSLVTCSTTAGYLHILVHPSWAPLGAQHFLLMVESKHFSTKVALMRCIRNFLCQFGIAGDPSFKLPHSETLKDDPNWLPEGPDHRTNELGVKRFGKGYLAYAGSGKNSRGNQLIVALKDNERLGGGSPWEVPWGEVVGDESYRTLDNIYTGYGDKGPSQGRLRKEGSSEAVQKDFPKLDYILGCDVIDSR